MPKMKVCNHCKIRKYFSMFWDDKTQKDGLRRKCKTCSKSSMIKYKKKIKKQNKNRCEICEGAKNIKNKRFCSESCYGIWKTHTKMGGKYETKKRKRFCIGVFCRGEKTFLSTWIGHRICPRCESSAERNYEHYS